MPPLFKNKARQPEFIVGKQFPHLEFTRNKNIHELGVLAQPSDLAKMNIGSQKKKKYKGSLLWHKRRGNCIMEDYRGL